MNAHTAITNPAALSVFWRKGRGQFVPMITAEVEAAGVSEADRDRLIEAGFVRPSRRGKWNATWTVTPFGAASYEAAGRPKHKASKRRSVTASPPPQAKEQRLTYDQQAAIDLSAWRARGGFGSFSKPTCSNVKSSGARRRTLQAAIGGPFQMAEFAAMAGYSSSASAAQMIQTLEDAGLLRLDRDRPPGRCQVRVMVTITPAGREWLAQNGGAA